MRFVCESDQLGIAVALAGRYVAARPAVPILAGMVVEAESDRVRVTGYDYEAGATAAVPAQVSEPGRVIVPGRMFAEVVRSLGTGELSVASTGPAVELTAKVAEFTLPTLSVEDYPALPAQPAEVGAVDGRELATALGRVGRAVARDDTLPALSGVLVEMEADRIRLTGTDRFRVAVCELPWRPADPAGPADPADPVDPDRPAQVVLPGRLLVDLVPTLRSAGGVRLAYDGGSGFGLAGAGWTAALRLLDVGFPTVRRLFDTTFDATATFLVDELRSAVNRVDLVSDAYSSVLLRFAPSEIVVSAGADELTRAAAAVTAQVEGAVPSMAVNASYLVDGLNGIAGDTAQLAFNEGIRPALLTGSSDQDSVALHPYRYLLMPRRLPATGHPQR